MISYIKGTIINKTDKYIILENNGIGYQIFCTDVMLHGLNAGDAKEFYTHQYVKEDALDLYGFANLEELTFFKHLINISGVGPKSALAVLSIAKLSDIKKAIFKGDATLLKKVSGIGQKTAERIVIELKTKIDALTLPEGGLIDAGQEDSELMDALEALGYPLNSIRNAISQLPNDIIDTQAKIKAALKLLNNK